MQINVSANFRILYRKKLVNSLSLRCFSTSIGSGVKQSVRKKISDPLAAEINELGNKRKWQEVLIKLEDAEKEKKALTKTSLSHALWAMGINGRKNEAVNLLRKLEASGKNASVSNYNSVLLAHAAVFDWQESMKLLDEMNRLNVKPTVLSFSFILKAFSVGGPLHIAISLLDKMKQAGLYPNLVIYNSLLNICARQGNVLAVNRLHKSMREAHVVPDLISYTTILNACSKAGDYKAALKVFELMDERKISPDVISWNRLLDALGKGQQFDLALTHLESMENSGCKPDSTTYNCLISAAAQAKDPERAELLYNRMKKQGIAPTMYTFSALINVYANAKQPDSANAIFKTIKSHNLKPDVIIFNNMIKSCGTDMNRALEWIKMMEIDNVKMGYNTVRAIVNIAHNNGDFNLVDKLYADALSSGVVDRNRSTQESDYASYTSVIDVHMHSVAMSLAAVRVELSRLNNSALEDVSLLIITGRAKKGGTPVVRWAVKKFLEEKKYNFFSPHENDGAFAVQLSEKVKH